MESLNKSFSKIKSNHFNKNINSEMRNWASSYNLCKNSSRKRRSGNSTTTNKQNKSINKSYYTHRENSKKKNPSQIATEIIEDNIRKNNNSSKKHWESTNVSSKKHLLKKNLPEDHEQRIIHRDLLLKHSSIINNGSQTVRNHNNEILNKSTSSNDKNEITLSHNPSLSYHRKHKKQKKMKMMILKHGRIMNEKNTAVKEFHYYPETTKVSPNESKGKKLKNSKSRTRYAEYNQKDETIDDQI